jgi:NADH-quinone oxidoreductase subunit D/NADH-quinone oxidoreductase subunit C/D
MDTTTITNNFKSEEYFINMGPQHPATHGVLRLLLTIDGEIIKKVEPDLGYIHRSIEKMCERDSYQQIVHLTDRMDYLSSHINNEAVCLAVENALGVEVTDRVKVIRTIIAELTRIASHTLWWGVMGMDVGALTTYFYGFRDREMINDIFEETCGARLTMNYNIPGGLMFDIHPNFVKRTKEFIAHFKTKLPEYDTHAFNWKYNFPKKDERHWNFIKRRCNIVWRIWPCGSWFWLLLRCSKTSSV